MSPPLNRQDLEEWISDKPCPARIRQQIHTVEAPGFLPYASWQCAFDCCKRVFGIQSRTGSEALKQAGALLATPKVRFPDRSKWLSRFPPVCESEQIGYLDRADEFTTAIHAACNSPSPVTRRRPSRRLNQARCARQPRLTATVRWGRPASD